MHRRDFVFALPLSIVFTAVADDMPFDGVWQIEIPVNGQPPKYVMMKQLGKQLKLRDLETGEDYTGTVGSNGITFNMAPIGSIGALSSFSGSIAQGTLTGHTQSSGGSIPWTANKLTSVYYCSNHRPSHIAKSKEEMEESTRKNKCQGWQRARPDSLASFKY